MILLGVSIFFMSALAVCLRIAVDRGGNAMTINALYRAATGIMAVSLAAFTFDFSNVRQLWSDVGVHACIGAALYWLSGFTSIKAIQFGPLGVTWTIVRLSMLIPTFASILYWREIPLSPVNTLLLFRGLGIVLATAAVLMLGIDMMRRRRNGQASHPRHRMLPWALWLTAAFCAQGSWEILLRSTAAFPGDQHRHFLVMVVFLFNMVLSIPILLIPANRPRRSDLALGVMAGLCAFIGTGVRPLVLRDVPGSIVFPVTAIAVTLLVLCAGVFRWKERLGRYGMVGMIAAIIAILLLTGRMM